MTEQQLLEQLNKNPFVLAPMAGITDCAFRSFMKSMDASIVVTELVSANGLKYSSEKTKKIMEFSEDQRAIGIQIFGEDLDNLSDAAKICEEMGADFVDLNFGCPVPKVVKKGAGSAVLKDLKLLREVLRAAKRQIKIPLTIKIRTGWDEQTRNAEEVCKIAYQEGITWVAIHGRTRSKGYNGLADWDYIKYVKENSPLPVIGNGDILTANQALQRLEESKCDAVMIGRGCLKNPWIFKESLALFNLAKENKKSGFHEQDIKRNHIEVLENLYFQLNKYSEERIIGLQIKKLSCWFSAGYPQSASFRKEIFQYKENKEIYNCAMSYFEKIQGIDQPDTSSDSFLMGGHG